MSAPSGAPRSWPVRLLRNPWLWAALVGVATMHLVRPLMRRVPAPPPRLGQLPELHLTDAEDRPLTGAAFDGLRLLALLPAACDTRCRDTLDGLGTLAARYRRFEVPVTLWGIAPRGGSLTALQTSAQRAGLYPPAFRLALAPADEFARLRDQLQRLQRAVFHDAGPGPQPKAARSLVLVDDEGGLRGVYATDSLGLDEVYHRAMHLLPR